MQAFTKYSGFLALTILSIFVTSEAHTQERFRKGYIITKSNDTIFGYLQYRGSKTSSQICHFRRSDDHPVQKFNPHEISGYRFEDGKYFISRKIIDQGEPVERFLEFLIKGKASVYFLESGDASRYFLETEREGLIELSEPEKIIHSDSGAYFNIPKYKGKLLYMLADCPEIREDIIQTPLRPKPMIKYHDLVCTDEACTVFERRYKKLKLQPSVYAGYGMKRLKFGSGLISDYTPVMNAGAALQLLNLFPNSENITLETCLQLSRLNQTTLKSQNQNISEIIILGNKWYYVNNREAYYVSDNYIKVFSVNPDLKLTSIHTPVLIKYNIKSSRLQYGFGLGPMFTFNVTENKDIDYKLFTDRFGRNIPGTLFGGAGNVNISLRTGPKSSIQFNCNYLLDFLAGDVNKAYRFSSQTFQVNLRYNFYW